MLEPGDGARHVALALALLVSFSLFLLFALALRRRGRPAPVVTEEPARSAPVPVAETPAPVAEAPVPSSAPPLAQPVTPLTPETIERRTKGVIPKIDLEDDDEDDEDTQVGAGPKAPAPPRTQRIVYDEDAAIDEPTHAGALILVTASAQTDRGLRRKENEDSLLARTDDGLFVVADGMGGYNGGAVASQLAVRTIERAFAERSFEGPNDDSIPRRASELARAIQMANEAILSAATHAADLEGMGTTVCAARFSPNKQRVYIGHVGDSRIYRMRAGALQQMTSDHTMGTLGVEGPGAAHLSRAVGIWPTVPVDILLGKPQPGDLYLLCSDGLSKMVTDAQIADVLREPGEPQRIVESLVELANEHGGKDNVTVILVRVDDAPGRPGVAA